MPYSRGRQDWDYLLKYFFDLIRVSNMPWLQLKIITPRRFVESLEDSLVASGDASVTFVDNADQPILGPGLGETPLLDNGKVTGLFEAEIDTAKITLIAEKRFGNKLPGHSWELLEDKDW